jgi:hypothetical protein
MKAKVLIVFIAALVIVSCGKDVYTTSPHLTFTSVNGSVFPNGALIQFKLNVTDKQGDIQDSIFMQRITFVPACIGNDSTGNDTAVKGNGFQMPQFTGNPDINASITLTFTNATSDGVDGSISPCTEGTSGEQIKDSCYFKFWMKDNAGNISDTVSSPTIVLLAQ